VTVMWQFLSHAVRLPLPSRRRRSSGHTGGLK
jgi:hypothetical protein